MLAEVDGRVPSREELDGVYMSTSPAHNAVQYLRMSLGKIAGEIRGGDAELEEGS